MTRSSGHVLKELRILPLLAAASIAGIDSLYAGPNSGSSGLGSIAEREIARRMARMTDARQSIENGDKAYAEGKFSDALASYRGALEVVPEAPATAEWRNVAKAKFADAAVGVAYEMAKTGRYEDAHKALDEALGINPEHKQALLARKKINDPERYPVALTPDHVQKVEKVERGLVMSNSYEELGDHDNATKEYENVLRTDRYSIASRRGMERVEGQRAQYFDAARDHTRSVLLNEVNKGWETAVPTDIQPNAGGNLGSVAPASGKYLTEKMRKIVFPSVQFAGATIDEAVEFLRIKSRDLDTFEADPTKKGVNIILKVPEGTPPASISLDLKDVPMEEALRYITELASMKTKVESFAVLVVPISEQTTEQATRTFRVPPDFLTQAGGGEAAAAAAPADPFAAAPAAAASGLIKKPTALEVLKNQGIQFPDGASAVFSPGTSQLIVRNTIPNLDLVEAYVVSIVDKAPKMIYITTKFVEVSQKNTDELGFDWLIGPFNIPSSARTFGNGGTVGNAQNGGITGASGGVTDFPFLMPNGAVVGPNPVTRGNRSGSFAVEPDSIDGLISGTANQNAVAPGIMSLGGIFTDPQFQMVIRGLAQRKGVDLMSAPSVTTKSGQRATIEVIREFYYPTEFEPPEIPQQFGGNSNLSTNIGLGGGGSSGNSFPVTPTTPTTFEMKPIGVRMEVDPTVGSDGYTIELNMAPEVNEFEGFINYGSPIQTTGSDVLGNPVSIVLTENKIVQPVFSTRKLSTAVTVWDGQTVAMGGLIREDVQDVEDRVPLLGDLPLIGRLFQSKAEDHFKRNLMIFVTAKLIDPAGRPIKPEISGQPVDAAATGVGAPNGLFPPDGGAQ